VATQSEKQYQIKPTVTANGRTFEVDPGTAFDKAVHRAAEEAGLNGRYYVRLARRPGDPAEFVTPKNAPATVEEGMEVSLAPHTQGAWPA
jgi:hypothetical protein